MNYGGTVLNAVPSLFMYLEKTIVNDKIWSAK